MISLWHRLLLGLYYPFLALLGLVWVGAIVWLLKLVFSSDYLLLPLVPLVLLVVTLGQVLWGFYLLYTLRRGRDEMELRLPRKQLQEVYDLAAEVAGRLRLRPPDEIRLGADTVAHVYESQQRKEILVLGGVALAAFSREAVSGIIAHELAHFAGGDTRLSRLANHRIQLMALLEFLLCRQTGSSLNPLAWLVRGYHLLYAVVRAAHSRHQELLADQAAVRQVGPEMAAAALIYTTVTSCMPWANLSDIVESCVSLNQPMSQVFAEQVRRAQATSKADWQEACEKAVRQRTQVFDSHPALKDRLAALGIKPRRALKLALDQSGSPLCQSITGWEKVEKELSERLIAPYREHYLAKMDMAQILLGRPIGR